MEPTKRKVTAAVKKRVAGKQRFTCAGNIDGYTCPQGGTPFDEAGYEIDHIVELRDGGTNDESNLQALCLMCHRVKTSRKTSQPKKEVEVPIKKGKEILRKIKMDSGRYLCMYTDGTSCFE
jgi:5-methylcytosine-specific restriction endonuclease McrA